MAPLGSTVALTRFVHWTSSSAACTAGKKTAHKHTADNSTSVCREENWGENIGPPVTRRVAALRHSRINARVGALSIGTPPPRRIHARARLRPHRARQVRKELEQIAQVATIRTTHDQRSSGIRYCRDRPLP